MDLKESKQTETTSEKVVAFLNSVFQKDPCAIHSVLSNCVPCNSSIQEDEHAIVRNGCSDGTFLLSGLGLLNGCLTAAGERPVALQWADDQNGRPKLQGFCLYTEGYRCSDG